MPSNKEKVVHFICILFAALVLSQAQFIAAYIAADVGIENILLLQFYDEQPLEAKSQTHE